MSYNSQFTTTIPTSSNLKKKWLTKGRDISWKISRISHLENLCNRHKKTNKDICRLFKMNNKSLSPPHHNLD